jgi:hypothetical protein
MNTFNKDQIALQAHIEAENAVWVAQCEANGSTFYTTMVSDPEHWAGYDITTIDGYKRHNLIQSVWDLYKEVNGFRPRFLNVDTMSMEDLGRLEDQLVAEMQTELELEAQDEEADITAMMESGAPDRETAERWIEEAA